MNINTTNDWMMALAEAMRDGDEEMLHELDGISRGWMQTSEDREAQTALIEAAWITLIDE